MQQPRLSLAGRLRGRPGYRVANRLERRRFARALPFALDRTRVIERRDGRLRVADVDPAATGRRVADANLELVVSLCEREGIDYFLVPEANAITARIGVVDDRWDVLVRALGALARREPCYVGADPAGEVPAYDLPADPGPVVEVFRPVITKPGGPAFGRPWACRVERWTTDERGRLTATQRNPRASYVDPTAAARTTVERAGRPVATLAPFADADVFEVDFPIDAVYLWVDGADPEWQARKAAAAGVAAAEPDAVTDARFRDGGELRYAMRSLAQYAPWVRRVFLVTDRQVPSWLDTGAPGLTVVDHRELFGDEGTLPTFNSHAIGARLHHIDGLAEHYLYLNDDVFFGRDVTPATFFEANGTSRFFLSRLSLGFADPADVLSHEGARRNVAELLFRDFGRRPTNIFYHSPVPQRRSVMAELEQRYPDQFRTTWHNQFRSSTDIEPNSWLHHYYGYLTGRAIPARIDYSYLELDKPGVEAKLDRLARRRDRDVFCLNDHDDVTPEQHAYAADWLARYFPVPSSFEKRP